MIHPAMCIKNCTGIRTGAGRAKWLGSLAVVVIAAPLLAQHYRVAEMNTEQIRALDRSRTVVLLPGGILEEHGPYLPSFADGYWNERMTASLADAIVARPGWKALEFPVIPLGTSGANDVGRKHSFPGTYAIQSTTLRSVFMDLATELGEQGFRWIVVVHGHGSPSHNLALEEAGDYFMDEFGGRMVHLAGLADVSGESSDVVSAIPAGQRKEDGDSLHAGLIETSTTLFLRPDLVKENFRGAASLSSPNFAGLVALAEDKSWLGYFGAPRYATASIGALRFEHQRRFMTDALMKILDGTDPRTLSRYSKNILAVPGVNEIVEQTYAEEHRRKARQQDWLKRKGLN
jgi:creatinine amidohydrolase/Fe(II)-dependent formamide hydrolase-like protein